MIPYIECNIDYWREVELQEYLNEEDEENDD